MRLKCFGMFKLYFLHLGEYWYISAYFTDSGIFWGTLYISCLFHWSQSVLQWIFTKFVIVRCIWYISCIFITFKCFSIYLGMFCFEIHLVWYIHECLTNFGKLLECFAEFGKLSSCFGEICTILACLVVFGESFCVYWLV